MRLAASHHRRIICTKLSWTGRRREAVFCARTSRAAYICAMYASVCRCDACIPAPWPVPICNGVPAMMARSAGLARGAARGSTKFGPRGAMAVEEDDPGLRGAMAVEEDGLALFARGEPRICGGIHSVCAERFAGKEPVVPLGLAEAAATASRRRRAPSPNLFRGFEDAHR